MRKIAISFLLLFMGYMNMTNAQSINLVIINQGYAPPKVIDEIKTSYALIFFNFDDRGYALPIPAIGEIIQEDMQEYFVDSMKQQNISKLTILLKILDEYEEVPLESPEQLRYNNLHCNIANLKRIKVTIYPDRLEVLEE